jgi:hypothetical protein
MKVQKAQENEVKCKNMVGSTGQHRTGKTQIFSFLTSGYLKGIYRSFESVKDSRDHDICVGSMEGRL